MSAGDALSDDGQPQFDEPPFSRRRETGPGSTVPDDTEGGVTGAHPAAPLPPIGSFEAEMMRPRLGHVKLGTIDGNLWMWPEMGDPELVQWSDLHLIGQRGSLVKLTWGTGEALLEFPSSGIALDFSSLIEEHQTAPPRTVGESLRQASLPPSLGAERLPGRQQDEIEYLRDGSSSQPRSTFRRMAGIVIGLAIVALAAGGGIVLGQRLIGDGPSPVSDATLPVVIREAEGEGPATLGTFVADREWRVLWDNQGQEPLTVVATNSEGQREVLADEVNSGENSTVSDMLGPITVQIDGDGPWRVAVVERSTEG